MSGDGGASQPPPAGNEKPRAPKPVAVTSSFINKGGKTFAPKAKVVRRRPPTTEPQTAQTQEQSDATPAPEQQAAPPTNDHVAEEGLESGRSPKRRRTQLSRETEGTQTIPDATPSDPAQAATGNAALPPQEESTQPRPQATIPSVSGEPREDVVPSTEIGTTPAGPAIAYAEPPTIANEENDANNDQTSEAQAPTEPTRPRRRRGPWSAVNAPQDDEEEPVATKAPRKAAAKRKRKPITLREIDEEEDQEGEEETEPPPKRKRPSAKARGQRKVGEVDVDNEAEDAQLLAEKPRKRRKDKGKKRSTQEGEELAEDGGEAAAEKARPEKRRAKKKSAEQTEGEGEGEGEQQPKRRGRRAREPTPSDAEDEVIDPGATYMDNLASRNIRVGKLSEREKKLRENWAEIKQRQREKDMMQEDPAEVTRRLEAEAEARRAAQRDSGPRYDTVDGEIVLAQGSHTVNPEAAAEREREQMVVVQEDDLTNRITYKSFMRNNKRYPKDFMLPGQGKRWNFKDTEDFYSALAMFGTDFMMISTLFPGVTRRSVKTKFVREERKNPQRIKEVLHGRVNSDWDQYLAISGIEGDSFGDPDEINRQLKEEEERMDAEVKKAKDVADEERRQRRLAGVESEEGMVDKENGKGKKKKERKKAAKQVGFAEEEGVEILGEIDEDEGWARE